MHRAEGKQYSWIEMRVYEIIWPGSQEICTDQKETRRSERKGTPAAEAAQSASREEPEIKRSAPKYEGTEIKIKSP